MWAYRLRGSQDIVGPFTPNHLRRLIESGALCADDEVRLVGVTDWMTVAKARDTLFGPLPPHDSDVDRGNDRSGR